MNKETAGAIAVMSAPTVYFLVFVLAIPWIHAAWIFGLAIVFTLLMDYFVGKDDELR